MIRRDAARQVEGRGRVETKSDRALCNSQATWNVTAEMRLWIADGFVDVNEADRGNTLRPALIL